MSEPVRYEVTKPSALRLLARLDGVRESLEILDEKNTTPGYQLARLKIESYFNSLRAEWAAEALRQAAKNSIAVHEAKSIFTEGKGSKIYVYAELYDLADLAGRDE